MNQAFSKIEGLKIDLCPCPFCGGSAEWVVVPGEDYVMRCSGCRASTQKARWTPEEAAADWNAHAIVNDNFTITADTKIDEYLGSGIQKVFFSEYLNIDQYPLFEDGFLCSEAVIITEKTMLVIEPAETLLLYDEIGDYGHDCYKRPIAPEGTDIRFFRSKWRKKNLLSLEFQCGQKLIKIAANAEYDCMIVHENQVNLSDKSKK